MKREWIVLAAAAAVLEMANAQQVTSAGNVVHVVTNLDRSLELYRDGFGLTVVTPPGRFESNAAIEMLTDTRGAQSRRAELRIPGTKIGVELIEYQGVEQRPAKVRIQDPGAGILQIGVTALKETIDRATARGAHAVTGNVIGYLPGGFLQDEDGFLVELSQLRQGPNTILQYPIVPPAPVNKFQAPGIPDGGFEFTVEDLDRTVAAYRALGLKLSPPARPPMLEEIMKRAGVPGVDFRQSQAAIGHAIVSFIQFFSDDRKPLHTRPRDPGASSLRLNVRGLDALLPKLNAAGFTVVSSGGRPVELDGARAILVRDPNNLFLELIEPQQVI